MSSTACSQCGRSITPEQIRWVSGSPFCPKCIRELEQKELITHSDNPNSFLLTEKGERVLPGLKIVAYCFNDSMPIYQRWVSAGIAVVGEKPVCPCCLGKSAEMVKRCM